MKFRCLVMQGHLCTTKSGPSSDQGLGHVASISRPSDHDRTVQMQRASMFPEPSRSQSFPLSARRTGQGHVPLSSTGTATVQRDDTAWCHGGRVTESSIAHGERQSRRNKAGTYVITSFSQQVAMPSRNRWPTSTLRRLRCEVKDKMERKRRANNSSRARPARLCLCCCRRLADHAHCCPFCV